MSVFFTADTHFGHKNIITFCNRPFATVEEMDQQLVENWNEVVAPEDEVYHLGDVSLAPVSRTRKLLDQLNGTIYLIQGNHEKAALACRDRFAWIKAYHELSIDDPEAHRGKRHLMLFHYAMREWNGSHHGTFHLYGHSHGTLEDLPQQRSIDVGVDCHGYRPVSFAEVRKLLLAKEWVRPFG